MNRLNKQNSFILLLKAICREHPEWNVDKVIAEALRSPAPSYFSTPDKVARDLNSLIGSFGVRDSKIRKSRLLLLNELVIKLGLNGAIRKKPGKDGFMFRVKSLKYILKYTKSSSYFYSPVYVKRLLYRNFRKIK